MGDRGDGADARPPEFLHELLEVRDRLGETRPAIEYLARALDARRLSSECADCGAALVWEVRDGEPALICHGCGQAAELTADRALSMLADAIRRAEEANEAAWHRYHPGWELLQGRATAEQFYLSAAKLGGCPLAWESIQPGRLNDYELYSMMTCQVDGQPCLLSLAPPGHAGKIAWMKPPERIGWEDLRPEQREFFGKWPEIARRFRGHAE